jgi:hypothetical protein
VKFIFEGEPEDALAVAHALRARVAYLRGYNPQPIRAAMLEIIAKDIEQQIKMRDETEGLNTRDGARDRDTDPGSDG